MDILNNVKISVKLIGSFVFVAALLVGVARLGYYNMQIINNSMATLE